MNNFHMAYIGTFCHAPVRGAVEILKDALIITDAKGVILEVLSLTDPDYPVRLEAFKSAGWLTWFAGGRFVLPGFCDLHVHAPQWPQMGKALDVRLEDWLQRHTFPLEARFNDVNFASRVYEDLVAELLAHGTTSVLYFATIHQAATRLLADICLRRGQRALIGKVVMDNAGDCPDFYRETTDDALKGTEDFIGYVRGMAGNTDGFIKPVITPRFIPSCTDAALEGLGVLAKSCACHVQTHCSESDWQHGYVLNRHGISDTESLDRYGLLTDKTVLAHANLISDDNMAMIKDRGSAIAHCPLSNHYFSTAVFPLRRALEKGLKIGLGTDISGGPSPSILENVRWAVASSRALEDGVDGSVSSDLRGVADSRIDWRDGFYLATKGGGEALGLKVGSFEVGRYFDAVVIDPDAAGGSVRLFEGLDSDEEALQKLIYGASKANMAAIYVGGRRVAGTDA